MEIKFLSDLVVPQTDGLTIVTLPGGGYTLTIPPGQSFTVNIHPKKRPNPSEDPPSSSHKNLKLSDPCSQIINPSEDFVEKDPPLPPLHKTLKLSDPCPETANPKVFFDMTVDGKAVGRVVMELFAHTNPRTAENFRALCTGEKGIGKFGIPLHYKGSIIHDVLRNYITAGDGSGGESIYGDRFFEDENFINGFTVPGMIAMANRGPDTNDSQFFITVREEVHLSDENVVFGQVVQGLDIIKKIAEEVKIVKRKPSKIVLIADCGQIS